MTQPDDKFIRNIQQHLDEASNNLDGETRSRLNQARQQALAKTSRSKFLMPVASAAAVASVAIISVNLWTSSSVMYAEPALIEDIELLSSNQELEFYQNLEFYQWLDDEASQS